MLLGLHDLYSCTLPAVERMREHARVVIQASHSPPQTMQLHWVQHQRLSTVPAETSTRMIIGSTAFNQPPHVFSTYLPEVRFHSNDDLYCAAGPSTCHSSE